MMFKECFSNCALELLARRGRGSKNGKQSRTVRSAHLSDGWVFIGRIILFIQTNILVKYPPDYNLSCKTGNNYCDRMDERKTGNIRVIIKAHVGT